MMMKATVLFQTQRKKTRRRKRKVGKEARPWMRKRRSIVSKKSMMTMKMRRKFFLRRLLAHRLNQRPLKEAAYTTMMLMIVRKEEFSASRCKENLQLSRFIKPLDQSPRELQLKERQTYFSFMIFLSQ